ncbi:MAG: hypothetical protein K0R47_3456 [Brevibacillus sp.]|nr:hypothetical protein [Brevibacillus sp.]
MISGGESSSQSHCIQSGDFTSRFCFTGSYAIGLMEHLYKGGKGLRAKGKQLDETLWWHHSSQPGEHADQQGRDRRYHRSQWFR